MSIPNDLHLSSAPDTSARRWLGSLALLLLVAATFGRVAMHEFVNLDDDQLIFANTNFLPPTWHGLAAHWREPSEHLYIPVIYTAWWLIAHLALLPPVAGSSGYTLNPWVFHTANLLVHAINVLLVRHLLRTILRNDSAAVVGAMLFAVHPLQVEAIAWASGMKDLLSATFCLAALAMMIEAATRDRGQRWWWLGAGALYALALLAKPSAVVLPIVALILLWVIGASWRSRGWMLAAGIAMAIPIIVITRAAQPMVDLHPLAWHLRPLVAADALAFYTGKLFWPVHLSIDYGRTPTYIFASGAARWTWLVVVLVTALVLFFRRKMLIAGWAVFAAALAANLGLLPFQFQVFSTVSDRYAYLAMLGPAIALGWIFMCARRWHRPAAVRAGAAVIIFACCFASFVQAGYWRDSYALWHNTIAMNDRSALAWDNLGSAMLADHNAAGAVDALTHATQIDPTDPFAYLNLTRAQLAVGDDDAAAASALKMASVYRRRRDFNPQLTARFLEMIATATSPRDPSAAERLREQARSLESAAPTTQR